MKVLQFQCPRLEGFVASGLKVAEGLVISYNGKESAMEKVAQFLTSPLDGKGFALSGGVPTLSVVKNMSIITNRMLKAIVAHLGQDSGSCNVRSVGGQNDFQLLKKQDKTRQKIRRLLEDKTWRSLSLLLPKNK